MRIAFVREVYAERRFSPILTQARNRKTCNASLTRTTEHHSKETGQRLEQNKRTVEIQPEPPLKISFDSSPTPTTEPRLTHATPL
jgi:ferritin-like metal-binding protein YciE